jgi:glycosyltransferase involved in cell wall biosynthesis
MPARVVIVQRYVTHYRAPFFERLRADLASHGVRLELVHGLPDTDGDMAKRDAVTIPWAVTVHNRWVGVGSKRVLWQGAMPHVRGSDLAIVEQASARSLNYHLFVRQLIGRSRLAFWGHGKNFKPDKASRSGEWVKRVMSRRVHWWFAYNALSAEIVHGLGYPAERITDVQNAIDTRELLRARRMITAEEEASVRARLALPPSHVGVYVGGMYAEKRLGFLVAAAEHIRELVPDFSLILIGAGPDTHLVQRAAQTRAWMHYLGPKLGAEKVPYVAAADLMLMPGLVGLAILDSFALGTPIVTTASAPHSPEIQYLDAGRNGVMLPSGVTPRLYAEEVAGLLLDHRRRDRLLQGCRESAGRYTIEEMSARFTGGVLAALEAPPLGTSRWA